MRLASLAVVLFLLWLVLSGHYIPFLVGAGAACAILCVAIAARMGLVDAEGHPVHLLPGALTYFPWLSWEISKSAWRSPS
jgi:multicomponent Na+:H+ antiporter subunit E